MNWLRRLAVAATTAGIVVGAVAPAASAASTPSATPASKYGGDHSKRDGGLSKYGGGHDHRIRIDSKYGGGNPGGFITVAYQGYVFHVPRTWSIVSLAAHPHACIRTDQNIMYLGTPGASETCPAHGAGPVTESMLVQPAAARSRVSSVRNPVGRQITVTAPRIKVTATYAAHQAYILSILASAGLPAPVTRTPRPAARSGLTPATVGSGATSYTGKGFDACTAPSSAAMTAWRKSSPYQAIGIYIGGSTRSCGQPNLTASWVTSQAQAGWHFIPIYAGPQGGYGQIKSPSSQAVSAADDAVTQAQNLGFGLGTPVYYDMEAPCPSCTPNSMSTILTFLSDWTSELHRLGYESAVYSSSTYVIKSLAGNFSRYTMPDVIFDALWNNKANTSDPNVPAGDWSNHQRVHQYQGNQSQTYGGVQLDIDQDYLDVDVNTQTHWTGGPATYDPLNGTLEVYGSGTDGKLDESWWSPGKSWATTALTGAPSPVTGRPSAIYDPLSNNLEVYATGTDGALEEYYYAPGKSWRDQELTPPTSAKLTGSPSAVYDPLTDNLEIYAVAANGDLDEFYWTIGKGWRSQQLSGAPSSLTGSPAAVYDPLSQVLEVYAVGANGDLEEYFWTPANGWKTEQQTPPSSAILTGSPSAVYDPLGGSLEVYCVGSNGDLAEFYYAPGKGWRSQQLSGAPSSLTGSPAAVYDPLSKVLEVYGTGANGNLEEYFWTPANGWKTEQQTSTAFSAIGGSPFAVYDQAGQHLEVYAVTSAAALGEYYYAPGDGWKSQVLPDGTLATL